MGRGEVDFRWLGYSARIAAIGLTRIARRAETTDPAQAISSTSPMAAPIVSGSAGSSPKRSARIARAMA